MSTEVEAPRPSGRPSPRRHRRPGRRRAPTPTGSTCPPRSSSSCSFVVPTFSSFFFSLTRWDLSTWEFIGLDNYVAFFQESALITGLKNTLIYAVVTCGLKVVLGMLLALLLTSQIIARGYLRSVVFFPVLVSTIGVGLTFQVLMDPRASSTTGWPLVGINGPAWLVDPKTALLSVALVDVWKGVGLATVIFIAGIVSIPREYFEAAASDGATAWQRFWKIILPLSRAGDHHRDHPGADRRPAVLRPHLGDDPGRPGFTSDVIASVIYKQYQAGFYGLSTAGNVVLFLLVTAIVFPLFRFLTSRRSTDEHETAPLAGPARDRAVRGRLLRSLRLHLVHGGQDPDRSRRAPVLAAHHLGAAPELQDALAARDYMLVIAFINSIVLTVVSVTVLVVLSAMVAYVAQRRQSRWSGVVNFLVLCGLIIPPAVVPTVWVLQSLGLFKTLTGLIFIEIAFGLAFCILLFQAFIATIPRDLDEAAIIDGAGPIRLFFKVIFPLLRSVMVTVIIVQSVAIFNDFANPLYFLPGDENATVQLTVFNFQSQFPTQYNLLFADILLITIPPLLLFLFLNKRIVEGMTAGAVKG